jgi:hypothetical protein
MGRSGVAFVAMMAAVVSAAALGYAVFWAFTDEPQRAAPMQHAVPIAPAPVTHAPIAPTPQPPAVVFAPPAQSVAPVPSVKATAPAEAPPPVASAAPAEPPAASHAAPASTAAATTALPEDAPASLKPDVAKVAPPARDVKATPAPPPSEAAASSTPPPPVVLRPPGPFAALPKQTDAPLAAAPAVPPTVIRRAQPHPHLAALPPAVRVGPPVTHEARPITILRGGPAVRMPQPSARTAAVALPVPPAIQVMRPRPAAPRATPSGPLILRLQD